MGFQKSGCSDKINLNGMRDLNRRVCQKVMSASLIFDAKLGDLERRVPRSRLMLVTKYKILAFRERGKVSNAKAQMTSEGITNRAQGVMFCDFAGLRTKLIFNPFSKGTKSNKINIWAPKTWRPGTLALETKTQEQLRTRPGRAVVPIYPHVARRHPRRVCIRFALPSLNFIF